MNKIVNNWIRNIILSAPWDIKFVIPGNPKALKRHRTFHRGKFTGTYDPSMTDKADFLALSMQNKPITPYDEPLFVLLSFYFSRPKNHYRSGSKSHLLKDSAPLYHSSTPDNDNLEKLIGDSLNGIFWKDDSRISVLLGIKEYSTNPRIEVCIMRLYKEPQTNIFN